ncbi:MAG TPA: Ig-like domain-containing protein [Pirellulales bacterium]|nr:Ig-like domain-containing protein [Pirellulales bacterium]
MRPTYVIERNGSATPLAAAAPNGLTPAQLRRAYGFDQISLGGVQGDGAGQTIAIIDAYDSPTIQSDLHSFDAYWTANGYNLPDPPSFTRVAQDGSTNYPSTDPAGAGNSNGTWETETALDVEWAHVMAPKANLLLVEANSILNSDLFTAAVGEATSWPGLPASGNQPAVPPVAVVTMSFGIPEFPNEGRFDSLFTTPTGHAGMTFLASTGDKGQPGEYPAFSPNVVAVGGTTLSVDANGNRIPQPGDGGTGESGWSGSGGGISGFESQPAFQNGVVTQSSTMRETPDVAFDAGPSSGVSIYDSWDFGTSTPWLQLGGTSLSSPPWAALVAIADQERVAAGLTTLDGPTQTLPTLYSMPGSDFHDIVTGNNGSSAGPGYDLVTGRGSPIAPLIVNDLVGPFTVASSIPAGASIVSAPPADFVISFVSPYAAASVQAASLTVNGIAADSFTETNATTITFHYNASPVTAQGLQTISLAAGAISRQLDGAPLAPFNASFRYDALPITVDSTTPANGSTAMLPLSTLDVHFNEAYSPSSISIGNLSLSQGSVIGYSLVDSQTVAYQLTGINSAGTLTIAMAAGAVTDLFGNPGPAYSGSLLLSRGAIPFPTPLAVVAPAGSLIYQNSVSGSIAIGGVDTFTLTLAARQTLTLLATPAGSLQAQLSLTGPGVSSSASSSSAGAPALLQTVAINTAGTYSFTVSGANGSAGSYTLQAELNAAISTAMTGGATNRTLATSQNIDSSFVPLAGAARRGGRRSGQRRRARWLWL